MLDDDVERRLRALGDRHGPAPRARFVDELGHRLAVETHPRRRPPVSRLFAPVLSAAAAVIVTLLVTDPGSPGVQTVRMASSIGDVEIVRPDGSVVAAREGMTIEDGSLIRVRSGRAEVGGVLLGAGEVAEVDDGIVEPTGVPTPTTTTATAAPTTTAPTTTTTAAPTTAAPTTTTTSPPVTQVAPPTTQGPTTTTTVPATTTTTVREPPQQMRLAATINPRGQVVLRWSGYLGPDFSRYLVLRADAPDRPQAPGQGSTVVVFQSTDQQTLFATDHPRVGADPVYRVVAFDDVARRVVATTFAMRPQLVG